MTSRAMVSEMVSEMVSGSRTGGARKLPRALSLGWAGLLALGCSLSSQPHDARSLTSLRGQSAADLSTNEVARQLLLEMLAPAGRAETALALRQQLDRRTLGEQQAGAFWLHFARGFDDSSHGRLAEAPAHFLRAVLAASRASGPEARMVAWLSASRALALRRHDPDLWKKMGSGVRALIETPGGIGWRARAQLVQWWLEEMSATGSRPVDPSQHQLGCVTNLEMAGSFSSGAAVHLVRSYAAEQPGAWPRRWQADPVTGVVPRVVSTVSRGCEVVVDEQTEPGVYYVETYLELAKAQSLIVAVRGALSVWVDDHPVLNRDPRTWGIWSKFGVQMHLEAGRHRLVARLSEGNTLVRVLRPNGTPLPLSASTDAAGGYLLAAPQLEEDPNDLLPYLQVDGQGPRAMDPLMRYVVARLAHLEGDSDVATVIVEPLVEPVDQAAGPLLSSVAEWVAADPVMSRETARDRAGQLHAQAVQRDEHLWRSQLSLALRNAGAQGLADTVEPMRQLVERFDQVPLLGRTLGTIYGKLGWRADQERLVFSQLAQYPRDLEVLVSALPIVEATGQWDRAQKVRAVVAQLDPDNELLLEQLRGRRDFPGALRELQRLMRRRPDQNRRLSQQRASVRVEAGLAGAVQEQVEVQLARAPTRGEGWLARGDLLWAENQPDALREMLGRATEAGADTRGLARAIDTVDARTDFAPYRIDGAEVVRQFEATGVRQQGTAARVLDYAAIWVHSDGSSRMLEHEILRVQSAEAIGKFAEHRALLGLVLQMRVIKPDGTFLEPETVAGKPTVTFPHLEVGDYIETESLQSFRAQENGRHYGGMRWYFREEDVAYAHSELLVISPEHRQIDIELTGDVPPVEIRREGMFTVRRWQVNQSPAATAEPLSPPVSEFLPSVRIGWGHGLERRLQRMAEQTQSMVPVDPRVRQVAEQIAGGSGVDQPVERARKLYRWVQDNVSKGESQDGRQAVLGKQGSRWQALQELLRALAIPVETAVVKNRLAAPNLGALSESETYAVPLLWLGTGGDGTWLTVQEKYAPFGYVPAEARGMKGYLLSVGGSTPIVVPAVGYRDQLRYQADIRLDAEGHAKVSLRQTLEGKYAVRMRGGLDQVPEAQLREVVESRLLARALPGARLSTYRLIDREDLEKPLVIEMEATLSGFAELRAGQLIIDPPLMPRLSQLTSLPVRNTSLLIREAMHQHTELTIALPRGAKVLSLQRGTLQRRGHHVAARDRLEGARLVLDREVSLKAGRVAVAEYQKFKQFTNNSEVLLSAPLVIELEP